MKVFVLSKEGRPLMPTTPCRARHLVKAGEAVVAKASPFTIRMAAGSKHVGLSASTEAEELFRAEVTLRDDIPRLMTARRQSRRTRRSRLRYRPACFDNRRRPKGWLTPTMETKVRTHENVIDKVCSILPVSRIVIETASFDIQRIKDPGIEGEEYQQGEQLGYENVKAYVKARDGFRCRSCGTRDHLEVHHIRQRKDGGSDSPDNLVTLCHGCHMAWHEGKKDRVTLSADPGFRAATQMSTMRWILLARVRKAHPPRCAATTGR